MTMLTRSTSIQCDHSDSEGKVRMATKCFQGDDNTPSFLHRVVDWVEPNVNCGCISRRSYVHTVNNDTICIQLEGIFAKFHLQYNSCMKPNKIDYPAISPSVTHPQTALKWQRMSMVMPNIFLVFDNFIKD